MCCQNNKAEKKGTIRNISLQILSNCLTFQNQQGPEKTMYFASNPTLCVTNHTLQQ
jgi:hypothetical protein